MKVSINKAAFRRKDNFNVFTVEDSVEYSEQDVEGVQIVDEEGDVIAELVYTPETPTKRGARAYLNIYDESKVRLV